MTVNLHCRKCCTGRTGDVLGAACKSKGCDGIIEAVPEFKDLVDEMPEPMTCGRRLDIYAPDVFVHSDRQPGKDRWQKFKTNGNRVCSFCGSLHPEDFLALVKACSESPEDAIYNTGIEIEPSDKSYKIYVHQPGVRNAQEGGIKFYTQHLTTLPNGAIDVTGAQLIEYKRAVQKTKNRFDRYLETMRPAKGSSSAN